MTAKRCVRWLVLAEFAIGVQAFGQALPFTSGSPSFTAITQEISAGGVTTSPGYTAENAVGVVGGEVIASLSYEHRGGVVFSEFPPLPSPPVILGSIPAVGPKSGGQTFDIVGFNFQSPGYGSTAVSVNGIPAAALQPISGTVIPGVLAPPGVSPFDTSLGPLPLSVLNGNGAATLAAGDRYLP